MDKKLFRDGQAPPPKALEIIVGYLRRKACPVYMGILSLEVGYSLARTQEMMDLLEDRSLVRKVTPDEKKALKMPEVAHLYVLNKPTT